MSKVMFSLVIWAVLVSASLRGESGQFLTLVDCYQRALQVTETIGLREADIKIAEARYRQAFAPVLPQLSTGGTFSLQNNPSGATSATGGNERTRDRLAGSFTVTQTIFNGFRDFFAASARKAEVSARGYDLVRARENLYLNVADVFYQILSYERDLVVLTELKDSLTRRDEELKRRLQLGRSRSAELLAAQSELADVAVTVEETKGVLGASRELLAFLLDQPANGLKLVEKNPFPTAPDLKSYVQQSAGRADVLAGVERERSARRGLDSARGAWAPTVAAEANYFAYDNPKAERDWNVFLTVNLPIFDGGLIGARVKENQQLVKSSQLNLAQLQRSANYEVRSAHNNFTAQAAQYFRLQEADRVQAESYRVQQEDYNLGRASNLDVLQALSNLQQTRRRLVATEMQARASLVALQVAAGTIQKRKSS